MSLTLVTKRCGACGEELPLSGFHKNRASNDGHSWRCKPCANEASRESAERRRARMGDAAFLAQQREVVRKVRQDPLSRSRGRASDAAYRAALHALRRLHQAEFDALLARERYERGLS